MISSKTPFRHVKPTLKAGTFLNVAPSNMQVSNSPEMKTEEEK